MSQRSLQSRIFRYLGATILVVLGCGRQSGKPAPPALGPELYGAGLFSTGAWDFFLAFAPDRPEVLFCRANADFSAYRILETHHRPDGSWEPPVNPRFAGEWSDADPHIAPDGQTLFFISNRPATGLTGAAATYDIWYSTRDADGQWGNARPVGAPVSQPGVDEWSPSVTQDGSLYFGTERPGGRGGMDLWMARRVGEVYQPPENLGDSINTAGDEVEPWIAPDQSYLIFSAKGRADSVGRYDLYVSRRAGGVWQRARPIGHGVNTPFADFNPSVSPDGLWLYFSSTRPFSGSIGERFDTPRDAKAVTGIGNGQGDNYRIRIGPSGIPADGQLSNLGYRTSR